MTKDQKRIAKATKGRSMAAFVALVVAQQQQMGRFRHWRPAYLKRCLKRGLRVPDAVRRMG